MVDEQIAVAAAELLGMTRMSWSSSMGRSNPPPAIHRLRRLD